MLGACRPELAAPFLPVVFVTAMGFLGFCDDLLKDDEQKGLAAILAN